MRIRLDMRPYDLLHEQSGEVDCYSLGTCMFCGRQYSDHPDYDDIPDDECCPECSYNGYILPGEITMED